MTKILIIEDDPTQQMLLRQILAKHELSIAGSGEEGLELAGAPHELVILDINLPGIDGYETCLRLRDMSGYRATPIIFLSACTSLDERLDAYGAGGTDYIAKPFDPLELKAKIDLYSNAINRQKAISRDLAGSHDLLMNVQTSSAKLQSINRFIQATLFCHDVDSLFLHFFKAAREMDVGCVLQIHTEEGTQTRASDGSISKLESEILEMSNKLTRIFSFGHDRAIFHWRHATLLTRKVGDMIDTLAIFMDALEAGIKSVETEAKLLQQVQRLEAQNDLLRKRVAGLVEDMNNSLRNTIISLGLVASLDIEEEDKLSSMIEQYGKRIDHELQGLKENNAIIRELVAELRAPPEELQALMNVDDQGEDDGILLF